MAQPRVIVVGAGPAGVRCAEVLVSAGLRPTVVDESARDGGQIYRRQPETFTRSYATLYGTEAERAQSMHRAFDALRAKIDYLPQTLAWNIAQGQLYAAHRSREITLPFDALVLCTGAADRLMPVSGWHFAGTFSLGGAQVALKTQGCSIGRRVVFAGTGALLYLVASQYVKAGAQVAAVLDTSPLSKRIGALVDLSAVPGLLWNGARLTWSLRRAGVPLHNGIEPVEIEGSPHSGVQAFTFKDSSGLQQRIECDAVAIGYHLRPEAQLADLAKCEFAFDAATRQWLPFTDADGRSSVPGIYLAGDGARVLGAQAAEITGQLAAHAVLHDAGFPVPLETVEPLRAELQRRQRFARGLAKAFPWPNAFSAHVTDDTIVCRCESITAGDLRATVRDCEAQEANRAKSFSRVGMGRCQGRYCGHAAAEIIADATRIPIDQVGRLRGQAPVKPLPIRLTESET